MEDKHSLTLSRLDRLQETLSTSNSLNEELQKENVRLSSIVKEMEIVKKEFEEAQTSLAGNIEEKKNMQKDIEALNIVVKQYQSEIGLKHVCIADLSAKLLSAEKQIDVLQKERTKGKNCIQ